MYNTDHRKFNGPCKNFSLFEFSGRLPIQSPKNMRLHWWTQSSWRWWTETFFSGRKRTCGIAQGAIAVSTKACLWIRTALSGLKTMLFAKKITHNLQVCSYVFAIWSKSLGQVPITQFQVHGEGLSYERGGGGGVLLSKCKLQNLIPIHRVLNTSKSFYL